VFNSAVFGEAHRKFGLVHLDLSLRPCSGRGGFFVQNRL
jgi:hypothetical protein